MPAEGAFTGDDVVLERRLSAAGRAMNRQNINRRRGGFMLGEGGMEIEFDDGCALGRGDLILGGAIGALETGRARLKDEIGPALLAGELTLSAS